MKEILESRDETIVRVKLLKRAYKKSRRAIRRAKLKALYQKLEESLEHDIPCPTLASDVFANGLRRGEVGLVEDALASFDNEQIRFFHAVLARWSFPTKRLGKFDADKFAEGLRYHVRQCRGDDRDGFLFARIHGECEPHTETIWPHWHGVATGGMVAVLRRLKLRYRELDGPRPPRVKVKICKVRDLKGQVDYMFQSFWPSRYRGPASNDDNKIIRQHKKGRMPEPCHTDWVLLMDKTNPYDLILIMGNNELAFKLRSFYRNAIIVAGSGHHSDIN